MSLEHDFEEDYYDGPLPHWAIGHSGGQLLAGAQLPTRDGRHTGNAHITKILEDSQLETAYELLTDAGSELIMTAREIAIAFHEPTWLCDVDTVRDRFSLEPQLYSYDPATGDICKA